ncbi:dihydropteroate synthase [Alcanivorax limicola]|uniref:dihydropteroate synthase n=1 Tax=Alcanivorax limicola TaxID=2874102 RepID=UPI001CBE58BA|nr:dihydropteroate synthase [Alcanivorax limicola]
MKTLQCGARTLTLSAPVVMGVLNVTPDSFSDGGRFTGRDAALQQARQMHADGAAIIDVGGESTRPGALPVSEQEELDRVIPVVEAIAAELDTIISLDTSTPVVIREGARAGAGLINDVRALQRPGALDAAALSGLPVCLMHMQGEPDTMQQAPRYDDVVADVLGFLRARVQACEAAGIGRERLLLDPGFGFGKTLAHNLRLLRELDRLTIEGLPLLVGMSRKSMIAKVLGREVDERLPASLALAVMAAERGADILRVHDVRETSDALRMAHAVLHGA